MISSLISPKLSAVGLILIKKLQRNKFLLQFWFSVYIINLLIYSV